MSTLTDTELRSQIIGRLDLDQKIYRVFRYKYLKTMLKKSTNGLSRPSEWDDPREDPISLMGYSELISGRIEQTHLGNTRLPVYAQCWTMGSESDAMWRIYSVVNRHKKTLANRTRFLEGVLVSTTVRKLLASLVDATPPHSKKSCYLGVVKYYSEQVLLQSLANNIAKHRDKAFPGAYGAAKSLLLKRNEFDHEKEVRLMYMVNRGEGIAPHKIYPFDANNIIDEMILDPRLNRSDATDRENEIRSFGYVGSVRRSDLYQGIFVTIPLYQLSQLKE